MSASWHIRSTDDYNAEGGPAFGHGDHMNGGHPGMSLRDWFAGQALVAQIGHPRDPEDGPLTPDDLAFMAYAVADAMLAAREADPS